MDALTSPRGAKLACIGGALGASCLAVQLASKRRPSGAEKDANAIGTEGKRVRGAALSDDTASEAPAGPAEFFRISTQEDDFEDDLEEQSLQAPPDAAAGPAVFYRMSTDDSGPPPLPLGMHSRPASSLQLSSYLESAVNEAEAVSMEAPAASEQQDTPRHGELERRPVADAMPLAGSRLAWNFLDWQARLAGPWAWQGALACAIASVTILQASAPVRSTSLA